MEAASEYNLETRFRIAFDPSAEWTNVKEEQ